MKIYQCWSFQFLIVLALIGFAAAVDKDSEAVIVEGSEKIAEYFTNTGYDYKFKTSNGIHKDEVSDLAKEIVTGSYEYLSPEVKYFYNATSIWYLLRWFCRVTKKCENNAVTIFLTGKTIKVTYTAGAGIGFNPRSTPDVIPQELIDAVELNLKNPPEPTRK